LIFENRGAEVGATIPHPHGQIYAFGHVPPAPAREAALACDGCTVCADLAHEREDGVRVVYQSLTWTAYVPFASQYPYGLRVVANAHTADFPSLTTEQRDGLGAALQDVLGRYDRLWANDAQRSPAFPYLLWFHQAPRHHDGEYHLHAHLAPPQRGPGVARFVASGELGSGMFSNPVIPEAAAAALREA
jgi:UDPglucose--hexose-1-phosphate uridylyltransferase